MSLMGALVLLTFVGANLHAILWKSSEWLVSTVLPAVVVELTNEKRAALSAAPLQRNIVLDEAARQKAEHMAKNQYFAHYSPDGVSPWYWFDQVGYVYAHAGENLAIHFTDSSEVVEAWMKSPAHRENIVGPQYTEIGVGTAKGTYEGYDTIYVVQLFGAPGAAPAPKPVATPPPTPVPEPVLVEEVIPEIEAVTPVEPATEPEPLPVTETLAQETVLPAETTAEEAETPAEVAVETLELAPVAPLLTEEPLELTEAVTEVALANPADDAVVFVESSLVATSSGLAIAQVTTPNLVATESSVPAVMTQPNSLLQMVYFILGTLVIILLILSIILEARRFRLTQVAYGFVLLAGMGVLWYAHVFLTSGAVVV